MNSFPNFEPVHCSMSSSNCCFLTCIQISQEAGEVVWYSHLLEDFPQFVVIHTIKGFSIICEAEVDVFLEFSCFFHDPANVGNLISGSSAFSKTSLYIWKFMVHILLKPGFKHGRLALSYFYAVMYSNEIIFPQFRLFLIFHCISLGDKHLSY